MVNNKIILSIETTCDIPIPELEKMHIAHLSLTYRNEKTGEENPNLTIKQFYDEIRNGATFKTSLINEYEFNEYFKELIKQGDVLHLGFDGSVSGTCECAKKAAKKINLMENAHKVYVVDTLTGSGGQAILLREVYQKLNEGKTIEELVSFAEDLKTRICLMFSPENMKTLAKSGRVNHIIARIGGMLNIKPIIFLNDKGEFRLKQMVIGRKNSIYKLIDSFKSNYNFESNFVYVLHSDNVQDAEFVVNELKKDNKYRNVNFIIEYLGMIVGSHGGPGLVCLAYTAHHR